MTEHSPSANPAARGRARAALGPDLPPPATFSFRRGVIDGKRRATWEEHWPAYGLDVTAPGAAETHGLLDLEAWFGRSAPTVVEIGSGTGTSTAAMAQEEPDVNVLAVEVYRPGHAQLLARLIREDISCVRLILGDAVDVMHYLVPPHSLTAVRVFFPDPWPKARHHKRRLLQTGMFELIESRLAPTGILHVATDHEEYAEYIRETGDAVPCLQRCPDPQASSPVSLHRPVTKFEGKGLRAERPIAEFFWQPRAESVDASCPAEPYSDDKDKP